MSQKPPPGGPEGPKPPAAGARGRETSAQTSSPEPPATTEKPAQSSESDAPVAPAIAESVTADPAAPDAATEEETIEAQGVGPAREASVPTTGAKLHQGSATPSESTSAEIQSEQSAVTSPASEATTQMPTIQAPGAPPHTVAAPTAPNGAQVASPVPSTVTRPASPPTDEIVYTPFALSIGDGFKFGCGLVLAMFVTTMAVALIVAVGFLVASLAGIPLPIGAVGK